MLPGYQLVVLRLQARGHLVHGLQESSALVSRERRQPETRAIADSIEVSTRVLRHRYHTEYVLIRLRNDTISIGPPLLGND
jgi:hypothetical protein